MPITFIGIVCFVYSKGKFMNRRTALKTLMLTPIGIAATSLVGSASTDAISPLNITEAPDLSVINTPLQNILRTWPSGNIHNVAAAIFNPFNQVPVEFKIIESKVVICINGGGF